MVAKGWEQRGGRACRRSSRSAAPALRAVWDGPLAVIAGPARPTPLRRRACRCCTIAAGETWPGRPTLEGARNSLDALELAVGLTRSGAAAALVTGPVSKAQLYAIGFTHPGQTEFVAERCGVAAEMWR